MPTKSLDLGCGIQPKNPFNAEEVFGIDIRGDGRTVLQLNLITQPIPAEADTYDYVTAYDFVEHIPRILLFSDGTKELTTYPFIRVMNEIWRVLKYNGLFYSKTPAYPHPEAFQDPTHCNIITEKTFPVYFNDHYPVAHIYGFEGGFKIISQSWDGFYLCTTMQKKLKPNISVFTRY
jgi:hypothetical protein